MERCHRSLWLRSIPRERVQNDRGIIQVLQQEEPLWNLPEWGAIVMLYGTSVCTVGGCVSLVVEKPLNSANFLLKIKIQIYYINSFSCGARIRVRQKIIIFRKKLKKINFFPRQHFFCLTRIWIPLRKSFRMHFLAAYFRQNSPIMDMAAVILTHGWTSLHSINEVKLVPKDSYCFVKCSMGYSVGLQ